jgi:uncharacterized protein YfaS (alpha-2-macroglobulin family)
MAVSEPLRSDSVSLDVTLSASLLGNLDGAFRYMRDYPYACWEQRLSKAIMAAQHTRLRDWLDPALDWPGADALPATAMADAHRFQAPNGGMAYWQARNERTSPYLSAYTALAFGWLAHQGVTVPTQVEQRLHGYLQRILREELTTGGGRYGARMAATTRAVALAALAQRGALSTADLDRYAPHAARMSLFGKAHFLRAALEVAGDGELARSLLASVLGHGERSAGRFSFNESADGGDARIHSSALRSQCAALSSLVRAGGLSQRGDALATISTELARGVVASRGSRPHWRSTQENLFCMQALADYAERFENEPVAAEVRVMLAGEELGRAPLAGRRAPPVTLSRRGVPLPAALTLQREGRGRVYWKALLGWEPAQPPVLGENAGIEVHRELSVRRDGGWQLLDAAAQIRRGDVVKVDLFVSVPGRRHFVVVDDPVPGGLEPVNADLATSAASDLAQGEPAQALDRRSRWFTRSDWRRYASRFDGFYHRELRHAAVRFFADALDAGHYHLSYTAQAVAEGRFGHAPVRAEEMYDPEIYGTSAAGTLAVTR